LKGGHIVFPKVSVGATHAALMAAVLAKGDTLIENAAREPEIGDVAECLVAMGARIDGIHSSTLRVSGVTSLHGAEHQVISDRIETGTYAMAAAMAGGDVTLKGAKPGNLDSAIAIMAKAGVDITRADGALRIRRNGSGLNPVDVATDPYRLSHRPAGPAWR
jgi:UDP-N-acetylglucosamine 1-carboxyvinyltransferase